MSPVPVAHYREVVSRERVALKASFLSTGRPGPLLRKHAALVDRVLRCVWRDAGDFGPLALVAVGGYARRTLFPHSDVDVLILVPEQDQGLREQAGALVAPIWDIGLEIGHSIRSIAECLDEAARDITIQTTVLEARWVAGSRALFREFSEKVSQNLDPKRFLEAKLLEQQQRHNRFNDTASNLEPNVKEGLGGLRDLNTILWVSSAACLGASWHDLAQHQLLTASEAKRISHHEAVLQHLRIRLHYQAGRREDRLLFDLQAPLAKQLALEDTPQRLGSERMMQRYFRTAREVTALNDVLLHNLRTRIDASAGAPTTPINERFVAEHEYLKAVDENVFERQPSALLECFSLLQQHPELKGLAAGTLRALWRGTRLIDHRFRRDPANQRAFLGLFQHGSGLTHALRRMNRYGVLGRYLPAFGRVVGQMQHDLYHVYAVDEHILMVVRNLRRFAVPEMAHEYPLCSRLMSEFAKPELLYLAGLFHDIAKGRGGDHSALGRADAARFCRGHGMEKADTELVVWLVEQHLVMSSTAQKKDLADPEVIANFATLVRDERHLIALYLLTVADIRGTSPKVWNAWKGKLLEDLFWSARRFLGGDRDPSGERLQSRQKLALEKLRLYAVPEDAHEKLWAQFDTAYFLRHDAREVAWHTRVLNYRVNTPVPVVKARVSPAGEGIQVLIYTPDRKNLFAQICAFFERVQFSIIEARIYTTLHGYALDTFQVMSPEPNAANYRDLLNYIEHELCAQLERDAPLPPPVKGRISRRLKSFPVSPEVSLRPDERGNAYYLSVTAGDRPGLLSSIARVLVRYEVDLRNAKINTMGERAEDTFVVAGEALKNTREVIRLESELLQALQS
ncbi:MAG: [protein-PII] uridylyltransferase [Burkholderiales bacterium]